MENKKNTGLIVSVIMLFIIVLGLSGFIGYHIFVEDVKVKDDNKKEVEKLKAKIKTLEKENRVNKENKKTEESETAKVKRLFIDYLENSKEKPLDYKINTIVIEDDDKDRFGYEKSDLVAWVDFSVKVKDINNSDWIPANGEPDLTTNWINNKSIYVLVKNDKMSIIGTGL